MKHGSLVPYPSLVREFTPDEITVGYILRDLNGIFSSPESSRSPSGALFWASKRKRSSNVGPSDTSTPNSTRRPSPDSPLPFSFVLPHHHPQSLPLIRVKHKKLENETQRTFSSSLKAKNVELESAELQGEEGDKLESCIASTSFSGAFANEERYPESHGLRDAETAGMREKQKLDCANTQRRDGPGQRVGGPGEAGTAPVRYVPDLNVRGKEMHCGPLDVRGHVADDKAKAAEARRRRMTKMRARKQIHKGQKLSVGWQLT